MAVFDLDLDRVGDTEFKVPTIKDMNENPGVIKWTVYQISDISVDLSESNHYHLAGVSK